MPSNELNTLPWSLIFSVPAQGTALRLWWSFFDLLVLIVSYLVK